jgi:hypothetical protein
MGEGVNGTRDQSTQGIIEWMKCVHQSHISANNMIHKKPHASQVMNINTNPAPHITTMQIITPTTGLPITTHHHRTTTTTAQHTSQVKVNMKLRAPRKGCTMGKRIFPPMEFISRHIKKAPILHTHQVRKESKKKGKGDGREGRGKRGERGGREGREGVEEGGRGRGNSLSFFR